jgi:hypothetical protein
MIQAKARSTVFQSDIDGLQLQVFQKRLMQAGITLCAVSLPLTAAITPNQSLDAKFWELGLGSLFGGASAYVAKAREDLENRYKAYLELRKDHEKGSIKQEFGFHSATQLMRGELNLAGAVNSLAIPTARLRYADKFQLQGLVALPTPDTTQPEENKPEWLNNPFGYTPASQSKPGEVRATHDWILDIVNEAIAPYDKRNHQHLIVNAPTQQGKSTLVACFIGLFSKALNGKVTTLVIDPKHSDTNWLVPVDYAGFDKVADGLKTAIDILDDRKKQAKKAQHKGLPKPDFERVLIILDEWNIVFGQGKGYADIINKQMAESFLADVQRLLAESAFVNMTLFLIGQSPLSTDNGLSRPMMENATRITLTKTAIRWLNDKDFPNPELKAPFKKQINAWIKEKRRCALIVPMIGEPHCQLVPHINLDAFDESIVIGETHDEQITQTPSQPTPPPTTNAPKPHPNLFELITNWYTHVYDQFGHYPNDETLRQAWFELTKQVLTDNALADLRNRIHGN